MKQISETFVGGRIRKARSNSHMKIKDLASVINVSANYISLVERGDKKPSAMLLEKIADATNVSLDWLRDGDGDNISNADSTSTEDHAVNELKYKKSMLPDIRMFLALILMETQGMSKEKLAITLDVSDDVIDAILKGEDTNYRPQWEPFFSGLAQRLDTATVCGKLRTLTAYLEAKAQEAEFVRMMQLSTSLQRYTEENCKQELKPDGKWNFNKVKAPVPYRRIQFLSDGGWRWEFRYVQAADIGSVDYYATETMGNLPQHVSLSIVFDDRAVYEAFIKKAIDYAKTADMPTTEAPAGCPLIRAMLIDRGTYVVQDEENCWPVKND